jgi:alpha-beta hydrolase superfamily lysophospholipase
MGSFIVRCILQRYGERFAGAIIMGTSDFNPLVNLFVPVTKNLNHFATRRTNPVLDKILKQFNNLPFRKEPDLQGFNWLNSDPKQVKTYLDDKLCGFQFTNNGYFALMSLMQAGTNKHWYQQVPRQLPMLFVSGKDDPVGQMGKGIARIVKRLQQNNFTSVSMQQYEAMRHEILLEPNHQQVYDDILAWLTHHIN